MATLNRALALYGASCHVPELHQVVKARAPDRRDRALALLVLVLAPRQELLQGLLQVRRRGVLLAPSRKAGSC